ncbi:MAG: 4Fe-4S binding protein [Oscillospiraceae bacterium]|nr:4Fe-4S binding protein [Oscillospiraceae bacterium]
MAYIITGSCIECGKCEKECPKDAIYQSCGQFVIIKRKCIECGRCSKVCPVGAAKPRK